jgi:hypothetical protein
MERKLTLVSLLALAPMAAHAEVVDFEGMPLGAPPTEWIVAKTDGGAAPQWEIVADQSSPAGARVLAQLSEDATSGRFPLAIHPGAPVKNGAVSVRFKPVSGSVDRAAGLVWRYRDENNYYLVRANALEDNVVLYKVERGRRTSLAPVGKRGDYGAPHRVPAATWSTLRVAFAGSRFVVSFDNAPLFEVEDTTFAEAGRVGVWTKADSVTFFDGFELLPASD